LDEAVAERNRLTAKLLAMEEENQFLRSSLSKLQAAKQEKNPKVCIPYASESSLTRHICIDNVEGRGEGSILFELLFLEKAPLVPKFKAINTSQ
jgi:hypothetical protein